MAEGGSLTTFESPLRHVHEREKDPGTAPNLLPSGRRAAGRVNDRAPSGESAAQQVKAIGERVMRIASKFTEAMDKDHDRTRATERESRKAVRCRTACSFAHPPAPHSLRPSVGVCKPLVLHPLLDREPGVGRSAAWGPAHANPAGPYRSSTCC